MNSLQKLRVATASSRGFRCLRHSVLSGLALASVLTGTVYGQGQYYPVNPQGAPYGSTYTGITVHSSTDLQFLQSSLQSIYGPTVTLQVPLPTGSTSPTTAQFSAAVSAAVQGVVTGNPGVPAGVTLATVTNEAVAWRPADRNATTTASAQAVVNYSVTPAAAVSNLNQLTDALTKAQPTLIDTIAPSIFNAAGASTDPTVASSISQLVATAVGDIPTDTTRAGSLINSGLTSLSLSTLTAAQKTTAFTDPSTGIVALLLGAPVANNNPVLIDAEIKGLTYGGFASMASLTQVLNAAVVALPTQTNATLGALVGGALRSQGGSATTIGSVVAAASPGTAAYTNAVIGGYSNSATLAAFQGYVSANPTLADAIASGAAVKATLTPPVIVQWALRNGSATPSSVVAATVGANQSYAVATVTGAINTTTHTPYGTATFADIALGGATAAPVAQVGNVVQAILQNSASSITALNTGVVTSVVDGAIQGATAGGNTGAYADIVYKAESVARNTSGASSLLVQQAVTSIKNAGGSSFIAVVAALAGDVYGANRSALQTAGFSALSSSGGDVTAATSGANLIQAIQTNASKTFTNTISAFYTASTNASPTNSVIADLYGAVLSNPNEADAGLAAAIKQSNVSDSILTGVASDALRTSNTTFFGLNPALQLVRTTVIHIKQEALAGNLNDLFDFVGHQIVTNTSMTKDIAIAATVVDPDHAHFIAGSVAFNNPLNASASVGAIFTYAQITNPTPLALPSLSNPTGALSSKTFPGQPVGAVVDQPAAAAAITAALTTGILEANLSATDTQNALVSSVTAAVAASLTQNGTNLRGPVNPFNAPGDTTKNFQQSDGGVGTVKSGVQQTVGAAGAITGYIAEVTNSGDSTISAITKAVLTAAVGGGARPYALEIAQAAGQALRWVGGLNVSTAAGGSLVAGNPIFDIANAMASTVTGFATLAQLENAVTFGINQAAAGVIGAGAVGLNATNLNNANGTLVIKATGNNNSDFYIHRSATGAPVTDIFNL